MWKHSIKAGAGLLAVLGLMGQPAVSAEWPAKPITLVAPFTPGGTTDLMARAIAQQLQNELGQTVVVENKPGAGGTVGAAYVARSAPDGYTLLLANVGHAAAAALYKTLTYDFQTDLDSITSVAYVPNVLIVNKSLPVNTVAELVEYIRQRPGEVNYGSAGIGSTQHLSGELLKSSAKLDAEHVPYKGASPMMSDLIGGRLAFALDSAGSAAAQIAGGNVKALGVTTLKRASAFPDLPTLDEAGVPGYSMTTWYSLAAPKGLPPEVETKIYQAVVKAMKNPAMQKTLEGMAAEPGGTPPDEFKKFVVDESRRWVDLVSSSAIAKN
ncbi:Tripartite-type tricarboxylate transporter, receptor component TctC [Pollutimonas bauzanensis]|uniref:Tripartite-type tricarboxylate transporter, receptor component TctC n=1 Tax=Pollutimonas bauzanensis TaxID=658167 RepID=A0A1M5UT15_9BURK|nr:Tripartite-type tricarboxylate transporter, receptor component TctC [Pollutimonas bauzanensis]